MASIVQQRQRASGSLPATGDRVLFSEVRRRRSDDELPTSDRLTRASARRTTAAWRRRQRQRRPSTPAADRSSVARRPVALGATSCSLVLHPCGGRHTATATAPTCGAATRSATTAARPAAAASCARSETGSSMTQLLTQPPPPVLEVERRAPLLTAAELAMLRCDGMAASPARTWRVPRPSPIAPVGAVSAEAPRRVPAPPRRQHPALSTPLRPAAAPRASTTTAAPKAPRPARQLRACRHPGRVIGKCSNCPRRG